LLGPDHGGPNLSVVNYGRELLPPWLDDAVESAIEDSAAEWDRFIDRNVAGPLAPDWCAGYPLVVKYMPSTRAAQYLDSDKPLYIGSDTTFTWGKSVYVHRHLRPGRSRLVARSHQTR
jgi:hypothetical protein